MIREAEDNGSDPAATRPPAACSPIPSSQPRPEDRAAASHCVGPGGGATAGAGRRAGYGTRATKCLTLSVIVLVLACLVFAWWSLLRTPAAESAVEFLAYTTNATGRLATFRLTSGFRWPIRYGVATQTNLPNGHPTLNPPLPAFTDVPQRVAPGKSDTFSLPVPSGERHWVVLVGARKVTGLFDDLCMAVHRSLYGAKFWLPMNLDSVADKIPHEKITTHILVGPVMSDSAPDG